LESEIDLKKDHRTGRFVAWQNSSKIELSEIRGRSLAPERLC